MMGSMEKYPNADMGLAAVQESVLEVLQRRRKNAEKNLADIESAILALNEQPKLLETLDILRRVGI